MFSPGFALPLLFTDNPNISSVSLFPSIVVLSMAFGHLNKLPLSLMKTNVAGLTSISVLAWLYFSFGFIVG